MVKQTIVKTSKPMKKGKSTKTQKKVNKIVVQIRRVPSTEKITRIEKSSGKSAKGKDGENPKQKYRKYERKKLLDENSDKFKFSIVDYLRTSISDKLGIDDIKKLEKEEKKVKKQNGKLSKKLKDSGNDFGSYELLGNDPDDFMIPLDVVITTDPSAPEEDSALTKSEEGLTPMDVRNSESSVSDFVCRDEVSKFNSKVPESDNEAERSDNGVLDADSLRTAYKEILDPGKVAPEKDRKGTHFLLTDSSKSCELCGASFTCAYKLKRHMLSHSDERKFFCDRCGSGFKTSYHLSRHKTNVHSIVSLYSCEVCDKDFTSKISLKEHKWSEHPTIITFLCTICQKTFASKKGLKRHEKQLHIKM